MLLARLAQYSASGGRRSGGAPFDQAFATTMLARDERALEREEAKGRNLRRVSALRLRVEEQRIALVALASLSL